MSHCPGPALEDWLTDRWRLVVKDSEHGSGIRWAYTDQMILNKEQFAGLVSIYEPTRELVEDRLLQYLGKDEDEQGSWRDFCGYAFDGIPQEIQAEAKVYIEAIAAKVPRTKGWAGGQASAGNAP